MLGIIDIMIHIWDIYIEINLIEIITQMFSVFIYHHQTWMKTLFPISLNMTEKVICDCNIVSLIDSHGVMHQVVVFSVDETVLNDCFNSDL